MSPSDHQIEKKKSIKKRESGVPITSQHLDYSQSYYCTLMVEYFAPPNMTFQLIQLKKVKFFAYTGCYLKGEGTSFEQTKKKKINMLSFLFYTNIIPFVLFDQFKLQHLFLNNVQYQDQIFLLLSSSLSQRTSFEFFFI